MTIIQGFKDYAVVTLDSGVIGHFHFGFSHREEDPEPEPVPQEGVENCLLTEELLGGLTPTEFIERKKPVITGSPPAVSQWIYRTGAPEITLSEDPYDDGSNVPVVTLTGDPALANIGFLVMASRPISMSLANGEGVFDAQGDTTFKIKVIGSGPIGLSIHPRGTSEFMVATTDVNVLPALLE